MYHGTARSVEIYIDNSAPPVYIYLDMTLPYVEVKLDDGEIGEERISE